MTRSSVSAPDARRAATPSLRRPFALLAALAPLVFACQSGGVAAPGGSGPSGKANGDEPAQGESAAPGGPAAPAGVERFGAAIAPGPEVALGALLTDPGQYAGKDVITEGKVQRACTRKGCWMEISQGDDSCRVTFKDYGFFVPKDSAGASARIQGVLQTREVDAADVRHLESEGARFKNKKSDGTATEVRMVASAVELQR